MVNDSDDGESGGRIKSAIYTPVSQHMFYVTPCFGVGDGFNEHI